MNPRLSRERGTGDAKLRIVQVQLTSFESDAFSLAIQLNPELAMETEPRPRPPEDRASLGVVEPFSTRQDQPESRPGRRLLRPAGGVIGASCLSIIGMIEPGRTVRLYRQIH